MKIGGRIESLAQLASIAEVRTDAPPTLERIEGRELPLRAPMPHTTVDAKALGLPAPTRPTELAMDALAAAARRRYDDPRLATMFARANAMLEMRDAVRMLRRGAGAA